MEAVIKYFKPSSISVASRMFLSEFKETDVETQKELANSIEKIIEKMYDQFFIPYFSSQKDLISNIQTKSTKFAVEKLGDCIEEVDDAIKEKFIEAINDMFDHFIIPMSNVCSSLKDGDGDGDEKADIKEKYGGIIKESKTTRHNVRLEHWNAWKAIDGNSAKEYLDDNGVKMTVYKYWCEKVWPLQKEEIVPKAAEAKSAASSAEKKPRGRPKKDASAAAEKKPDQGKEKKLDDEASAGEEEQAKPKEVAATATKSKATDSKPRGPRSISAFELFQQGNKKFYTPKDKFTDPKTNTQVTGYDLSRKIWSDNFKDDAELVKPFNTTAEEKKKNIENHTYETLTHLDWDSIRSNELKYENGKYLVKLID